MIYTLTLNPAVDCVLHTDSLTLGKTNRAAGEEIFFGGKGINVSRMLKTLGVESTCLGFIAGFTGDALEAALEKDGIKSELIKLPEGFTRINVKISGKTETEINAAGPIVTPAALDELFVRLRKLTKSDTLVLSGSVPASLTPAVYGRIAETAAGRGARLVVDAEGEALTSTLRHSPFLVKPNKAELEGIAGKSLDSREDVVNAALELKRAGAENVLVSLGEDGALLVSSDGKVISASAPHREVVGTVGSGDSMVAGFLAGLDGGTERALKLGVAAGSATAFSHGLAGRELICELLKNI